MKLNASLVSDSKYSLSYKEKETGQSRVNIYYL